MSLDITHFAFGAAMTALAITFLVPKVWYPRTLVLIGGGWALLPDIHRISPVAQARILAFHDESVWVDLFWLHRTFDRLDITDSKAFAAVMLAFLIGVTMLSEHRAYRAPKRVKQAVGLPSESD